MNGLFQLKCSIIKHVFDMLSEKQPTEKPTGQAMEFYGLRKVVVDTYMHVVC